MNKPTLELLTHSQLKIAKIILKEQVSAKQIGERLGISHSTVTKQLSNIYKRLGVMNKAELLAKYSQAEVPPNLTHPEKLKTLTPTELNVIKILVSKENKSVISLSTDLKREYSTIRKHLSRAYKKLGVKDRIELFAYYSEALNQQQGGAETKSANCLKEVEEELQKTKALYKEMEQLYKELHTEWLNLKTEKWLLEEAIRIRDREIAELKAKLREE